MSEERVKVNLYTDEDGDVQGIAASETTDKIDGYSIYDPGAAVSVAAALLDEQTRLWAGFDALRKALTVCLNEQVAALGGSDQEIEALGLAFDEEIGYIPKDQSRAGFVAERIADRRSQELTAPDSGWNFVARRGACSHPEDRLRPIKVPPDYKTLIPRRRHCSLCDLVVRVEADDD